MGRTRVALLVTFVALAVALPGAARADHEVKGTYELPALAQWDKTHLRVLVVPPNHGQIFNGETGILNDEDPNELTINNSYVPAIRNAIHAWDAGIDQFGQQWLRDQVQIDVYVAGIDDVPPEVLLSPDILVFTDESEGGALGVAVRVAPCLVRMSKIELLSFTYADMYNVTLQEFGHCLGLHHVGSQGGVDPTSDLKHPEHDPMNGYYTHFIGDEGTHLHCISNLNIAALEFVFSHPNTGLLPTAGKSATVFMPTGAYGSTCEPPPVDWRSRMPEGSAFAPGADEPEPAPEPTPTEDPSDEPSEDPDPAEQTPPTSEIWSPREGGSLDRSSHKLIEGTVYFEGDDDPNVEVALAQMRGSSCRWWDATTRRLTSAPCDEPLWNDVSGWAAWRFKIKKSLPAGSYKALSRASLSGSVEPCCERGRNEIHFTLY